MSNNQKDSNVNEFNKFLQNNQDFLQEKYGEYFIKENISIKDFKYQAAISFIYDVFSFTKYQSDEKMNQTLKKSLNTNIKDFLSILTKRKSDFNLKASIQLLKYCIQNNEMFAVKYDKKDKKMKTQEKFQQQSPTQKEQQNQQRQQNQQNVQVIHENKQLQDQQDKQQQQNKQQQVKEQEKQKQQPLDQSQLNNQFGTTKQQQKIVDPAMIKRNLRQVFQFYCRQQQNIGAHTTFDRISHQCHTMTLGKFLLFTSTSGVKNEKIDRHLLTRKFKLAAQGKKQIDFQLFYEIIQVLATIDQSLIPKLGVDDKNNFKNQMKAKTKPFNTQDLTSREIRKPDIFVPKLTGHSGMMSDALAQQLKIRKQMRVGTSGIRQNKKTGYHIGTPSRINNSRLGQNPNKTQLKNESVISPKQLAQSNIRDFDDDLNFLQRMINAQETDQQWLRQYKLPGSQKKHVIHSPPQLNPMIVQRKGTANVVSDIKKRVTQIQRSQTRQSINLEKRKHSLRYNGSRKDRSSFA